MLDRCLREIVLEEFHRDFDGYQDGCQTTVHGLQFCVVSCDQLKLAYFITVYL